MKNLFLSAIIFTISIIANAQNVNIPDINFKAALINLGIDTNNDGQISFSEASVITSLYLSNMNIYDLTGIESFINLNWLKCDSNQLSFLNISNHNNLQSLFCRFNQLVNITVSNDPALNLIECSNNQLSFIDVSSNSALTYLFCSNNQITSLNVLNNYSLATLYCENNLLSSFDVSNNSNLENLQCQYNQLTNIDISNNPLLKYFGCGYNQILNIDVSNNPELISLQVAQNQISDLDISQNIELVYLDCNGNNLGALDVSNNINLIWLYISGTCGWNVGISHLDLTHNTLLQTIHIGYMPNLNEVCVWEIPFPPSTVNLLDTTNSPNVYFTDLCLNDISNKTTENCNINIYPNPSDNRINIHFENSKSSNIEIMNNSGRIIYSKQMLNPVTEQIDISDYQAGVYYIIIKTENYIKTEKIVKD